MLHSAVRSWRAPLIALVVTLVGWAAPPVAHATVDSVGQPVVTISPAGQWISSNWVRVSLTMVHEEPLAGFAVLTDQQPGTEPGTEVNQVEPEWDSWMPEGENWLHARAVLSDGTPGPATHYRVGVDTTAPWIDSLRSPSHPGDDVATSPEVILEWDVPQDSSGIAGYDVRVAADAIPPGDDSNPATGMAVSEPTAQVTLPEDGEWGIFVRAQDNAGQWGQFNSYQIVLDSSAPQAPLVTGSHSDGAPTSRRHLAMTFTEGAGDHVAAWTAVIDAAPDTVPDPSTARPEAQIATTLLPGDWWLHVAGVDTMGRIGQTTHVNLVVQPALYVLDVPAGRQLWGPTTMTSTCPPTAQALALLVVASDGTTTRGADMISDGAGTCTAAWDASAVNDDGRIWPDDTYDLAVVGADGTELSERVPVTVSANSTAVSRLQNEYSTGRLTADELAITLLQGAINPQSLDEQYRAGAAPATPTSADLATALTANMELSAELSELLTPTEVQVADTQSRAATGTSNMPPGTKCGIGIKYMNEMFDCRTISNAAIIYFDSDDLGEPQHGALPVTVQTVVDALAHAQSTYRDAGFRLPEEPVTVFLSPLMDRRAGLSLPSLRTYPLGARTPATILVSTQPPFVSYLPLHEYFHQVSYQYISYTRLASGINNPYWWLEGTAEWAAHFAQTRDNSPFAPTSDYADGLQDFLAAAHGNYDDGAISTMGGQEYGSFVMAQFLDEQKNGATTIEETWGLIGRGFGMSPARAIERVIEPQQSYASMIHEFREWTYTLDRPQNRRIGFQDPAADSTGLWRDAMDGTNDGVVQSQSLTIRPPHTSIELDADQPTATGSGRLSRGGALYVEFAGPPNAHGAIHVEVQGPDGQTASSIINNVGQFPTLCPSNLQRTSTPTDMRSAEDVTIELDADLGGPSCGNAVLVITNTMAMPNPTIAGFPTSRAEFTWTATFTSLGAQLSNGNLAVGMHSTGSLGYEGIGVQGATNPEIAMNLASDGWGVSNGDISGSVSVYGYRKPQLVGDLVLETFAHSETGASVLTLTGGLAVSHVVFPSSDPNVYRVNVSINRMAGTAPSSKPVMYRRTMNWQGGWNWRYMSTWARAAGGNDSAVAALTHSLSSTDPTVSSGVPDGYTSEVTPKLSGGRTIDLDLGTIKPGQGVTFSLYYGILPNASSVDGMVSELDVDVYSITKRADDPAAPVGVFAYRAGQ